MKKTIIDDNAMQISEDMDGTIVVMAGDTEFQKTLTEMEKQYIHEGMNWISKLGREIDLKSLHNFGYTLDQVKSLPEKEQEAVWRRANSAWNAKNS